jgi:hypothetical protein
MISITKSGTVVATSQNLRGILDYTRKVGTVRRVMVDRLPNNRARLTVVWPGGAVCATEFESFNVCVNWCLARRGFPGRLHGYTFSTLECMYRLDSSFETTPRDEGAAVYRCGRRRCDYCGCIIDGMLRASIYLTTRPKPVH